MGGKRATVLAGDMQEFMNGGGIIMTKAQELLFHGLEDFSVPKGMAAEIFVRLHEEDQQVQMMRYMVANEKATPEELLDEARRISGE